MTRRQRFALSKLERRAIAEDPELDRLLRYGVPPAGRGRRFRLVTAVGVALAVVSLFVGYPVGVVAGLVLVAVGLDQLRRLRRTRGMTGLSAIEKHLHENGFR